MMDKALPPQPIWPRSETDRTKGARKLDVPPDSLKPEMGLDGEPEPGDKAVDLFADTRIGYLVRDVHRAFSRALQARIASHGVSMGQWFFLRALWEEDGLTQRELSQRVGMMEPTTVTALNSMERRGLVERVRNPHDRRKVNIYLTNKGRALRDVLLPTSVDVNDHAVQNIPVEELTTAITVLQRMIHNLNGGAGESDGVAPCAPVAARPNGNGKANGNGTAKTNGKGNGNGAGRRHGALGEEDLGSFD